MSDNENKPSYFWESQHRHFQIYPYFVARTNLGFRSVCLITGDKLGHCY